MMPVARVQAVRTAVCADAAIKRTCELGTESGGEFVLGALRGKQ